MALDERFEPAFSIANTILDKDTGTPLAGGTIETFQDSQRILNKPLFQLTGSPPNYSYVQLPNPVLINAAGQPEDAAGNPVVPYYFPFDANGDIELYHLVVKNVGGVEQYTRDAVPSLTDTNDPTREDNSIKNELTNSQFVEVNFNGKQPITYTFVAAPSEVINIAPGWDIVVTGTGSLTLTRVSVAGSANIVTNPPYVLNILASNLTTVFLRQRLSNNPGIWTSGFISGYFIAESQDVNQHTIELSYQSSSGGPVTEIASTVASSGGFSEAKGTVELTDSTNPSNADTGFADIIVSIPGTSHIRVSSFQVVGLNTNEQGVLYDEDTVNRQKSLLFNEFKESILLQSKGSILSGWDFALNPFQFNSLMLTTPVGTVASYIADQTILRTETANSIGVQKASGNSGLVLEANAQPQGRLAIIQYIHPKTCQAHFTEFMSAAVNAEFFTASGTALKYKVKILSRDSLPPPIGASEPIVSWGVNGPQYSAGWTEISPDIGDLEYAFENEATTHVFNKFKIPASLTFDSMFAVILFTTNPMDNVNSDKIFIRDISLVNNDFAIESNSKTADQVLRECEGYFEKSYATGSLPGAVTAVGAVVHGLSRFVFANLNNWVAFPGLTALPLDLEYKTQKLQPTPTLTIYSRSGVLGNVTIFPQIPNLPNVFIPASAEFAFNSFFAGLNQSDSRNTASALQVGNAGLAQEGFRALMEFQYTVDGRLGI